MQKREGLAIIKRIAAGLLIGAGLSLAALVLAGSRIQIDTAEKPLEVKFDAPVSRFGNFIPARTADGREACLSRNKPVLVFADWCEYCDEALEAVARLPVKERLVLLCLTNGDPEETLVRARAKLEKCGLDPESCFYGSVQVDGVPALFLPGKKVIIGNKRIIEVLTEWE